MRFLSIANRELQSAARQKWTYRTRWITAVLFFVLLVWLMWVFLGFSSRRALPEIFALFSVLVFLTCLFLGAARTADCISAERREGTLGLLFLTNLNSTEIIAGKLCSTALASVYGLMAVFPMLALQLLMGGVTFGHFARTVLALLNGILFALAIGFLTSVVCRRQITAIAWALGLTALVTGGFLLAGAVANSHVPTRSWADPVAAFSPLYPLIAAKGSRIFGSNLFWLSAVIVASMSLCSLGLTTLLLAHSWRDRPKTPVTSRAFVLRSRESRSTKHATLRHRLLAINPWFWLASRQQVSAPVFMCLAVVLVLLTVFVSAPLCGRIAGAGTASPVLGHLLAWLWTGLGVHALVLYYAAMAASQRLAEDNQSGALELILSTPTTERTISRGLWLAFARRMLFPGLLAIFVHVFFLWICTVMATLDPPGFLPPGATPGEIFWSALLNQPLRGRVLDWEFGFMLRVAVLSLVQLILAWPTLGWVGRWLGLRMRHPGLAPITSLLLLLVPPLLLFTLACYVADQVQLDRLPERYFLPIMMWLALAIGVGHCLALSAWAATRLRHRLRAVALSRYQPLPPWRWHLPSRRTVRRLAIATVVMVITIPSLVVAYYGYHNWRSTRTWRAFRSSLLKNGESLDLSRLLAKPVSDELNFARSPAFLGLSKGTDVELAGLVGRMQPFDAQLSVHQDNKMLTDWSRQKITPLDDFAGGLGLRRGLTTAVDRAEDAAAILRGLQPHQDSLKELAAAAACRPVFQMTTNRDPISILRSGQHGVLSLERLHTLFQVRACAFLALGDNKSAAEDLLTGFRLARLARDVPDARSSARVQVLLVRCLQPLWEGLSQHAWTEPQLASFQHALAGFNLLTDYTNAVHRVVLAHIDVWRAIPASTNSNPALPWLDGNFRNEPAWKLQPHAWWYDNSIRLYYAGRNIIERVDVAAGRIDPNANWFDLSGLPLDSSTTELLQQALWHSSNPAVVAFAQTSLNQAIVACALERFNLANGFYPASLQELIPGFLTHIPNDAVSGRPLIYQPVEGGTFILRGVGPNGVDDRRASPADDWLWVYSTTSASSAK